MKKIAYIVLFAIGLSSCYKEYNPNTDLFDVVGDVAYVAALTANPATVAPSGTTTLTIKCTAYNTDMKEIKIYERIGTTGGFNLKSTIPFTPNFVAAEKLHVVTVPYTAPSNRGAVINIQVEVVTANGLASKRNRTLTVRTTN